MRFAPVIFLIFASVMLASAQNPVKDLEKTRISGLDYVRLKEWCDEVDLKFSWVKRDENFMVTNRLWKFAFDVDSRKAQVNGMNYLLSLPVVNRNNVLFISSVDVQNTIQPILFP